MTTDHTDTSRPFTPRAVLFSALAFAVIALTLLASHPWADARAYPVAELDAPLPQSGPDWAYVGIGLIEGDGDYSFDAQVSGAYNLTLWKTMPDDYPVEMPCGQKWHLAKGSAWPDHDIKCSCGNPRHWFFKRARTYSVVELDGVRR